MTELEERVNELWAAHEKQNPKCGSCDERSYGGFRDAGAGTPYYTPQCSLCGKIQETWK